MHNTKKGEKEETPAKKTKTIRVECFGFVRAKQIQIYFNDQIVGAPFLDQESYCGNAASCSTRVARANKRQRRTIN